MAFVDNDKIKKIRREGLEQPNPSLVLGKSLIDREVHFAALHNLAAFDLVTGIAEGREDPVLGRINQDVAVGQIKDPRTPVLPGPVPTRRPQLPANLKSDGRLPVPVAMVISSRR